MSNYTQSTNFATKDALTSGDPLKILKGTEINTEFANIAIAVATKADTASPTFTGTPVAPTASAATNTTQLATTAFVQAAFQILHPVGSIYINATNSTNPGTLLGFGTWTAFGQGRVAIGAGTGGGGTYTAGATGGNKDSTGLPSHTHTATVTESPHAHNYDGWSTYLDNGTFPGANAVARGNLTQTTATATTGITVSNSLTGTSVTDTNLQPYVVVYMWQRTA